MICRHLQEADEAYRIGPDGREVPMTVHICEWPEQHPDRFLNAPRWLLRKIGGGLAITPERDCIGCPAFCAHEEDVLPWQK